MILLEDLDQNALRRGKDVIGHIQEVDEGIPQDDAGGDRQEGIENPPGFPRGAGAFPQARKVLLEVRGPLRGGPHV